MLCLNKYRIQTDLGGVMGSVPDHHSKMSIAVKLVTNFLVSQCI